MIFTYKTSDFRRIVFSRGVSNVEIIYNPRTVYESPFYIWIITYDSNLICSQEIIDLFNQSKSEGYSC